MNIPAELTHAARTLRLTEGQAEAVETAAETGWYFAQPWQDRGRRQQQRVANALVAKSVLWLVDQDEGGYQLTELGLVAYLINKRVIRRSDELVAQVEAMLEARLAALEAVQAGRAAAMGGGRHEQR